MKLNGAVSSSRFMSWSASATATNEDTRNCEIEHTDSAGLFKGAKYQPSLRDCFSAGQIFSKTVDSAKLGNVAPSRLSETIAGRAARAD